MCAPSVSVNLLWSAFYRLPHLRGQLLIMIEIECIWGGGGLQFFVSRTFGSLHDDDVVVIGIFKTQLVIEIWL